MQVCDKCGAALPDSACFCETCGARLKGSFPAQPPVEQYPQPPFQGQPGYQDPAAPYQQYPSYQQPYAPGEYPYMPQKRSAPLALGIIGAVFALLLPLVTYCCSIPGLVMASKDVNMGLPNRPAKILNIIAISVAAVNSFFGIILFYNLIPITF